MVEIRASHVFPHAPDDLFSLLNSPFRDPRKDQFATDKVLIDLRDCSAVSPLTALWCVVYASLVQTRRIPCEVEAPTDPAVRAYLTASGFFSALSDANVTAPQSSFPKEALLDNIILPIVRLGSAYENEQTGYGIQDRLQQMKDVSGNIPSLAAEIFFELVNNAQEHSQSPTGEFAMVRLDSRNRVLCAVADGGIGIAESLRRNPEIRPFLADGEGMLLALQERVTGTTSPTRGIGLGWVESASRLTLYSGGGTIDEGIDVSRQEVFFPGTLAVSVLGG